MAKELKQYKLKRGIHRYPNPEFDPLAKPADQVDSHVVAKAGDMVPLNDSQFAAFSDRFEPAEGEASEVRDKENEKMERAKKLAEENEESVDPNVVPPIDSPSTLERVYQGTESGRAGHPSGRPGVAGAAAVKEANLPPPKEEEPAPATP